MNQALVLNATYQPLTIVSQERALILMLKNKAVVIESNGAIFRSEHSFYEAPSVIKLIHYVKVPFQRGIPLTRRGVFARDNWECQYCGKQAENIDHVVPKSKGGPHTWENVVASCRPCNDKKDDKAPHEVGLRLRSEPKVPSGGVWMASRRHAPEWEPYLNPGTAS